MFTKNSLSHAAFTGGVLIVAIALGVAGSEAPLTRLLGLGLMLALGIGWGDRARAAFAQNLIRVNRHLGAYNQQLAEHSLDLLKRCVELETQASSRVDPAEASAESAPPVDPGSGKPK